MLGVAQKYPFLLKIWSAGNNPSGILIGGPLNYSGTDKRWEANCGRRRPTRAKRGLAIPKDWEHGRLLVPHHHSHHLAPGHVNSDTASNCFFCFLHSGTKQPVKCPSSHLLNPSRPPRDNDCKFSQECHGNRIAFAAFPNIALGAPLAAMTTKQDHSHEPSPPSPKALAQIDPVTGYISNIDEIRKVEYPLLYSGSRFFSIVVDACN